MSLLKNEKGQDILSFAVDRAVKGAKLLSLDFENLSLLTL